MTDSNQLSGKIVLKAASKASASNSPCPPGRQITSWLVTIILTAVILFGIYLRVEDFSDWKAARNITFFDNKPLLGALDGYFYLRMSRDLLEHSYTSHDNLRNAPDGFHRPAVPPLLSCLAAGICRVTGWQLDWVGLFLPAFLGALLAIPIFAFGRYLSCSVAGIAAALAGLTAPYVIYRGGMGWFDTDCLNVTWTLATAYCFMRFGIEDSMRRYRWLLAGLVCTGLFLWWWDQSPDAVIIISLTPLIIALGFFYRPSNRTEIAALSLLVTAIAMLVTIKFHWFRENFGNWIILAESQIRHVTKQTHDNLPNFALSISEQSTPAFSYVVDATTRSLTVFILSTLGFALLVLRKPKIMIFLLPTFALGILAITCSERFLIFLSPLIAIGFGYLVGGIWQYKRLPRWVALAAAVVAMGITLFFPMRILLTAVTAWPKTDASRVAGMAAISELTPTNSLIWSWWDNGYAINYFARRATISDGQIHGSELAHYAAFPLVSTNPALAARFMQFYAACGANGMRSIKPADINNPESYPHQTNGTPVYIYLDSMTMATVPVWYSFGATGTNVPETIYQPTFNLDMQSNGVYGVNGLFIDTDEGVLRDGTNYIGLIHFMVREASQASLREYNRENGGCFELVAPRRFGVLMNQEVTESVFNSLFLRADLRLKEWFDPVIDNGPDFQIWKVNGN